MLAGLAIASLVRPDPKEIAATYPAERDAAGARGAAARDPPPAGRPAALVAAVASFAVMACVMNLAGYVAVGHGHHQGDVFTMISIHILGMYGLVLIVGDLIDRFGRRRALVAGLALMTVSNAALVWLTGSAGMSLALLGLGLGWNFSYVAATTELVSLTSPAERGRLIGFSDLLASLAGGRPGRCSAGSSTPAASSPWRPARPRAVPALWLARRPSRRSCRPEISLQSAAGGRLSASFL